jgi:hypothetical protein
MGNFITDLFSTKPAEDAAKAKEAGYANANTAIDTGVTQATPLYDKAYGNFSDLAGKFGKGLDAYSDATGVNGQAGIDRAGSTYKSLPGYSGGLTTGIDAAERTGQLSHPGGGTAADVIKFASDYDSSKFGNYLSALAPNISGSLTATSGGAGVLGSEAGNYMTAAGAKAGNAVGSGNAEADAKLAPYAASQNFWSSLMGGANLALKATGVGGFAPTPAKVA